MARPRPQAGVDEPALVARLGPETALLDVGRRFDGEPRRPGQGTYERDHAEVLAHVRRDGGQRGGEGQAHPQALQGPGVEKADEGRPDLVETGVAAGLADATEQVGAQASGPDHHQRQQQD